jgi:hypothetical protein
MNCEQFASVVHEVAREVAHDAAHDVAQQDAAQAQDANSAMLRDALAHADGCGPCDALLEEAEALAADMRSIAALHMAQEPPAELKKTLLRAVALRRTASIGQSNKRVFAVSASIAGIAAAALLMIAAAGHVSLAGPGAQLASGRARSARHEFTLASSGVVSAAASSSASAPALNTLDDNADLLANFGDSKTDDQTLTGSFVPLSSTFDPASLNDWNVVRVVISRSALDNLGLHLGQSEDAQIVADLVVTDDGVPEAIHVVSW